MNVQTLYSVTFPLAVPFWALMILAPKWSVTRRVMASPLIAVPPLLIFVLVLIPQFPDYWRVMTQPSLPALTALFGGAPGSAAIWAQFIGFDLFIGRWIYHDYRERGFHPLIIGPILVLTIFVSPLGLLAYLAIRAFRDTRLREDPRKIQVP